jgi:hypothetical protein
LTLKFIWKTGWFYIYVHWTEDTHFKPQASAWSTFSGNSFFRRGDLNQQLASNHCTLGENHFTEMFFSHHSNTLKISNINRDWGKNVSFWNAIFSEITTPQNCLITSNGFKCIVNQPTLKWETVMNEHSNISGQKSSTNSNVRALERPTLSHVSKCVVA